MAKKLTSTKARKILHDKEVHGHPLTEQQRKFFGAIAGGAEPYKAQIGTMLTALPSNMMDRLSDALGFPQKAVTKLVTGKYQTPSEAMNIQSPAGAIAADVLLDPLTFIVGGAGASKAAKAVKQSTKTGLLSRAHEYNPWAFKPQEGVMMYRGIGEEGMRDALESGLIRSKQNTGIVKEKNFTISKQFGNPYFSPSFETANRYGQGYIAEVPISAANWRRRYGNPNKTWSQIASREIPITEGRILKKDWLRGYKEVKPPKKKKQDGGWLDKYDAPQAQNGIEGTMGGLTDIGFNYNGAWGGTMQMGGVLPGAVGFMYARTQSPAPSNGPYAKKTKASAQDGKEMTYTWDPSGSSSDKYMLKRTVTPYTSKRDIRRFTQVPINPNDVNFISNYDHTSREDQTPNPTAVPYKGEKHWNIDRFIIQPHFSKINTDLQNADNDKKQMKRNVLADMYKYFMVQNQGDKKDAWKQAKQFMREEINPRVKGPFYDQYLRTKGMPLTGLGMSITDAISPQYMYWVNYMMEDAATGVDSFIARKYTQNPVSPSKYKKFGMDWLMNYKGLSRKEARDYLKQSEIFPNYTPSDAEPTDMTTGYRNGGSMKYYQEGLDFKPKTISQDGSEIPVDPMGYWNPENVGGPVIIPSNVITMEGVDQPLLGISDTGDVQYMEPGEDYEFDGEYVTEYPVAQKGKTIPVPTTADSARLYNAQVALNKFYENEMKAGRIKKESQSDPSSFSSFISGVHPQGLRQANLDFYRGEINQRNKSKGELYSDKSYKQYFNISPEQVKQLEYKGLAQTKGGSEYQDYYRDIITPMQNLAAPFALIDYRIRPQREILYSPIDKDGVTYPGGDVMVYDYDPLAIKPYHMRTPKEKIEWEKKYGKKETTKAKPTPPPVKKKVVTPAPEPVRQTAPLVVPSFTPPIVPSGSVGVFGPGKARIGEYDEKTNTFYPDYGNLAARSKANQSDTDLLTDQEKLASYIASKTGKKPKIDVTLAKQRNGGINNADAQPLKKLDQLLNFTNYNKPTKGGWLDKYN